MKIAVFGTPALAADIFEAIRLSGEGEIVAAVTMPDAPAGRKNQLTASSVKTWALERKIPVWQPTIVDAAFAEKLQNEGIELLVVIAYGRIFTKEFLDAAPPAWNLHLSLLPKYRGTSPVQAAILAGEKVSGVTVFRIFPGMDDGPILGQAEFSIVDNRADQVHAKILANGSELLNNLLRKKRLNQQIDEREQAHEQATFCQKISKDNGKINPEEESAENVLRKIRAYYPWPSVWFEWNGKRIKLLDAITPSSGAEESIVLSVEPGHFLADKNHLYLGFANDILEITEIQPEGKRVMSGKEFGSGLQ